MNVIFRQRNGNMLVRVPNGVTLEVSRYSKKAVGGCAQATLTATGERGDLYDFLNWLRVHVTITNDIGKNVWWGFISRVEVYDGAIQATADIENMANRIAVAYTTTTLGQESTGERGTTAWVEDTTSIGQFGTKELLDSRGGTSLSHAEAARDRLLAQKKYPTAFFEKARGGSGELRAVLYCTGWWDTLGWKYATVPTRLALGFSTIGTVEQVVGSGIDGLAQSFDTAAGFNLQEIGLYVKRVGTPPANLTVAVAENPDDATPGASLASATIDAADVGTAFAWMRATLSSPYALSDNSTYFVAPSTTGDDPDNYYVFALDGNQGYGAGVLRQDNGTNWEAGPSADMPFRLYANDLIETTQQIKSMITNFGQFIKKVYLGVASGIDTESYRDGDSDAQYEVEDLLEMGTSSNRRMLASVDIDRNAWITEQPASTENILMDAQGVFRYKSGAPLLMDECPVGVWVFPSGIVPSNVDMSLLLGVQSFFIEESEYTPATGELRYRPANMENPFDFGVRDG